MSKVVVIIVVLVILAGGGWWLYRQNHKTNPNKSAATSSTSTSTPSGSTSPSAATTPPSGQAAGVMIANMAFAPAQFTIKKGSTVTWTNQDNVSHTVTADDAGQPGPKSSTLAKGQSYSFTFNQTGTFQYHCSIHPEMHGTVTVTD